MLKVLSNILCDLDPKVKVIGQKAGICDGVPSTSALVGNHMSRLIYLCLSVCPSPPHCLSSLVFLPMLCVGMCICICFTCSVKVSSFPSKLKR